MIVMLKKFVKVAWSNATVYTIINSNMAKLRYKDIKCFTGE